MTEESKHAEQKCLEIYKMIEAISLVLGQLREQMTSSSGKESFADSYTRKMLEDNEINILKFLGRYLHEKENLAKHQDISSDIAKFPTVGQWLNIIGVNFNVNSDLDFSPIESILGDDQLGIQKLVKSSSLSESSIELVLKATNILKAYLSCLRSGNNIFDNKELLSWSHCQRLSNPVLSEDLNSSSSSDPNSKHLSISKSISLRSKCDECEKCEFSSPMKNHDNNRNVAEDVSPFKSRENVYPPGSGTSQAGLPKRNSVLSASNVNDGEEHLALRTLRDVDGVSRRKSDKRKGLWNKFMTWSSRHNNRLSSAGRPSSFPQEQSSSVGQTRRMISDPGSISTNVKSASSTPANKSRIAHGTPSPQKCMIHVFAAHKIFLAKCDYCQKPMAFTCLMCILCRIRIHNSCGQSLPQIPLNSFAKPQLTLPREVNSVVQPLSPPSPPPSLPSPENRNLEAVDFPDANDILPIDSNDTNSRIAIVTSSPSAKGLDIPHTVPEGLPYSDFSPPYASPNDQIQSNKIDSLGSSGTGDHDASDITNSSNFFNATSLSTPGTYSDTNRRFDRKPTRMSTFSEWSVALKEWLIPIKEISRDPTPIARGRYTTVYKGIWHGDVAVKLFHGADEPNGEDNQAPFFSSDQLVKTFKDEVSILPHTRHENLVLFQGASIEKESLFIVSTFCKGRTLDSLIYPNGPSPSVMYSPQDGIDAFSSHLKTVDSIVHTASQIAQAVGYLHNKGILHKDLRLRNIFIELNGRILLSDYGLFNATRLATNRHPDVLFVSRSWLFCLAPELARALTISPSTFVMPDMALPFSDKTDVFAFGCVWFELLHRTPPVENSREDCHILIHERGQCRMPVVKSPPFVTGLPVEQCHQLLARCWAEKTDNRPSFADITNMLMSISPITFKAGLPSHKRPHIGASQRFNHQPVRSPSQPIRGGSARGNRANMFALEPLVVSDESRK